MKKILAASAARTMTVQRTTNPDYETPDPGCWGRFTHELQDGCYQVLARSCWDFTVSGFRPGRVRSIELMDIQPTDRVLLVGEGSGLDLECLPEHVNKPALRAFDFSNQMVIACRQKAEDLDIPGIIFFRAMHNVWIWMIGALTNSFFHFLWDLFLIRHKHCVKQKEF